MIIFSELSRFVGPYMLKRVIDLISVFSPERLWELALFLLAMFMADQAVALINYFNDLYLFKVLVDMENYLPVKAQEKMVFLGLSYHEKENTGSKISMIQRGVDRLINLYENVVWNVWPTIIQVTLTFVFLIIIDWRFGIIFMTFVPPYIWLTYKFNRDVYMDRKVRHKMYEESGGQMAQSIMNINTVKSFVQEKRELSEFKQLRSKIEKSAFVEFSKMLGYNFGRLSVINLGRVLMLVFGVYLVYGGKITIGSLLFVFTISEKSLFSLHRISRLYDRLMESSEAVERLVSLSNEPTETSESRGQLKPKRLEGKIVFKEACFAYDEAKANALDRVSLTINADCVTALVGPSGGGKTTLARMIYRHYDPQSGEVTLDGVNLRKYDLYGFRRFISIVPQEVELFDTSVKGNISYGRPDASMREIVAAAKVANAEEFINHLPEKYETIVGERGVKLSGGQRQRIGIARAILTNPKILIFDEATSNLDSLSESLIKDAMEKIGKNRTMIIIAHRLATIQRADKIIVLEDGRVVEEGSHFELAGKKGGLYSKLLKLQQLGEVV